MNKTLILVVEDDLSLIHISNSVAVARYGALIRAKSPTSCDAHFAEILFQTRSGQEG